MALPHPDVAHTATGSDPGTGATLTIAESIGTLTLGQRLVVVTSSYQETVNGSGHGADTQDCGTPSQSAGTATLGTWTHDAGPVISAQAADGHLYLSGWSAPVTGSGTCTISVTLTKGTANIVDAGLGWAAGAFPGIDQSGTPVDVVSAGNAYNYTAAVVNPDTATTGATAAASELVLAFGADWGSGTAWDISSSGQTLGTNGFGLEAGMNGANGAAAPNTITASKLSGSGTNEGGKWAAPSIPSGNMEAAIAVVYKVASVVVGSPIAFLPASAFDYAPAPGGGTGPRFFPTLALGDQTVSAGTTPITMSDSGTGTELAIAVAFTVSDSGAGSEIDPGATFTVTDSGGGSDLQSTATSDSPIALVLVPAFQTWSGPSFQPLLALGDGTLSVAVAASDSGTGTDTLTSVAFTAPADIGTGTDSATTAFTITDSGVGVEATPAPAFAFVDTGTGTEPTPTFGAMALPGDSGAGADTPTIGFTYADTGAGVDNQLVGVNVAITDTGAGTETVTPGPNPADTGAGTDTAAVTASLVVETGTAADTGVVGFTYTDSGTAADSQLVAVSIIVVDTAAGTEALGTVTVSPFADTGAGTEPTPTFGTITLPVDPGTGVDVLNVLAPLTVADTGTATLELLAIPRAFTVADTGTGTNLQTVTQISTGPLITALNVTLQIDGQPFDLTGSTVTITITPLAGGVDLVAGDTCTVDLTVPGRVYYQWRGTNVPAGYYLAQFRIVDPHANICHVPNAGRHTVKIGALVR